MNKLELLSQYINDIQILQMKNKNNTSIRGVLPVTHRKSLLPGKIINLHSFNILPLHFSDSFSLLRKLFNTVTNPEFVDLSDMLGYKVQ